MMNYNSYNIGCLITSILMLLILSFKFKQIDLCLIFILASIFSIIWRSIKIIKGKDKIEPLYNRNKYLKNPYFILDFLFAILVYLCVFCSKQINKKFIILTLFIFILGWCINLIGMLNNYNNNNEKIFNTSQTMHFCGHCYVIFIVFITFYLYIN